MVNKFKKIIFASIMVSFFAHALPVAALENDSTNGICISMAVNSNEALLNGEPITLNNAPFFENGTVYVPLREIINLCGGIVAYIPDEQAVLMALKRPNDTGVFSKIWIGKARILKDTEEARIVPTFLKPEKLEHYVPIVKNGKTFIPTEYFSFCFSARTRWNVERNRIILSFFIKELSVEEFTIGTNFNSLDKDIRDRFKTTGRIIDQSEDGLLKVEVYTDGDMEFTLATNEVSEVQKDFKEIVKIVLITDKYKTPRGLRVGDSIEKYWDLYGNDKWVTDFFVEMVDEKELRTIHYDDQFSVEIYNGKVSKIIIGF
ncbi:stalk domain-containing protein [Vallitalea maricola]|uniref:Uncharacterized protein n=1 Tax=Vallitalea maricola TaxID=3074433 RepID=A0ACB5URN2_9FIRM|nr:hypothetical protein AN2V17_45740 [Vallitalea sp. AN17-2]